MTTERPASPPARRCASPATPLDGTLIGAMTGLRRLSDVPTLAIFLALSMRLAVGTSLAIITVTSLMSLAAHLGRAIDLAVTAR